MAFSISYKIKAIDLASKTMERIAVKTIRLGYAYEQLGRKAAIAGAKLTAVQAREKFSADMTGKLTAKVAALAAAYVSLQAAMKVVQVGTEFEDMVLEVSAITGATGKNLKFIKDESLRLARANYTSAAEVAEGFKLIASAKADLLDKPKLLAQVTEQALILKNAAGIDLATAAETLATSLNQFGEGAEKSKEFVDILAAGAKYGASEIADTAEALKVSGAAARIAGLSFGEANAAIQAMAAGGLKGSIAGRGFAAVLLRAQKAGLSFREVGLAKGFKEIFDEIEKIPSSQERATTIMKTFGLENVKTIETLLEQTKNLDDFVEKMKEVDVALEQATIQTSGFSDQQTKLGIILDEKMIKLFESLEPLLTEGAIGAQKFVDSFDADDIYRIAGAIEVLAVGFGTLFKWIYNIVDYFLSGIVNVIDLIVNSLGFLTMLLSGKITSFSDLKAAAKVFSDETFGTNLTSLKNTQEMFLKEKNEVDVNVTVNGNLASAATVEQKVNPRAGRTKTNPKRNNPSQQTTTAGGIRG